MSDKVQQFPDRGTHTCSWLLAIGRTGIGAACLLRPGFIVNQLDSKAGEDAARTLNNLTFGRDLAIGLGTLISTWRHSPSRKEWILAGLLADSVDCYSFLTDNSFRPLPRIASTLIAGSAVAMGIWALLE